MTHEPEYESQGTSPPAASTPPGRRSVEPAGEQTHVLCDAVASDEHWPEQEWVHCSAMKLDGTRCEGPSTKSSGRTLCSRHGRATPPPAPPPPEPPKPAKYCAVDHCPVARPHRHGEGYEKHMVYLAPTWLVVTCPAHGGRFQLEGVPADTPHENVSIPVLPCCKDDKPPALQEAARERTRPIRALGTPERTIAARRAVAAALAREAQQAEPALTRPTRCRHCKTTFEAPRGEGGAFCPQCGRGGA